MAQRKTLNDFNTEAMPAFCGGNTCQQLPLIHHREKAVSRLTRPKSPIELYCPSS